MILLIAFAFLAGVITVLSPCILPILPIILTSSIGGVNMGKSRPLGVVIGFILSFTFFTLFLSTLVRISGIPAETMRLVSVFVIAGFGVSLLIPQFQLFVEQIFSTFARFMPNSQGRTGFSGGMLIGLSVGLLWTPCVGPILASVISLAITGTVTFDAFLITLAYALGTAIPMFLIMQGGQNVLRKVPWLLSNLGQIQKLFGVLMILTAVGIFFNVDRKFQTFVLNTFPKYGVGLTKFEDNELIRNQLNKKSGNEINKDEMGKPVFNMALPKGPKAPEIIAGGVWFNLPSGTTGSKAPTLADLRGKVVIVDFWTYSCINCQRTLPYLREWNEKYKDKGLVIIGVHAPEFEFEKSEKNVGQAIKDFKLTYPVVQDNDFATWRAYDNHYWPAKYFIDKDGYIRHTHFGEGDYDESEKVIQELLKEAGAEGVSTDINNPKYQNYANTPETYLGSKRANDLAKLTGNWKVMEEYATSSKDDSLEIPFDAKEVYLVMRPQNTNSKVKVLLDGVLNGVIVVDGDKLYKLITLPTAGHHVLKLQFEGSVDVYAFTFG